MSRFDDEFVPVDAYEVVEAHWPYDGPYSPEQTTAAALMIERLVRYLNNATFGKPGALPYAATAGSVLASLHAAVLGLDQLAGQLGWFATAQAADPSLYDDRRDRPGAETAVVLAAELGELRPVVRELARRLEQATGHAHHLGNHR